LELDLSREATSCFSPGTTLGSRRECAERNLLARILVARPAKGDDRGSSHMFRLAAERQTSAAVCEKPSAVFE
jgi:hypothetical protein